jgi:DNA modification methylase
MNYLSNIPGDVRWNKKGQSNSKFSKPILNDSHGDIDFSLFAKEMYRVMIPNTYMVLHCNIIWIGKNIDYFLKANFCYKGTIAWNKRFSIGGDIKGSMKRDWEPILYLAKGKPSMNPVKVKRVINKQTEKVERERISEIADWTFQLNDAERTGFPTQKPKNLCYQIISLMSQEGETILDPFAGSGIIGKAAKILNRNSISFEADKDVFSKFLMGAKAATEPLVFAI